MLEQPEAQINPILFINPHDFCDILDKTAASFFGGIPLTGWPVIEPGYTGTLKASKRKFKVVEVRANDVLLQYVNDPKPSGWVTKLDLMSNAVFDQKPDDDPTPWCA